MANGGPDRQGMPDASGAPSDIRELAAALDLAPVIVRGLDGHIRFWGSGARDLYGFEPAEAVGSISHQLLRTVFPKPLEQIEAELLQDGHWRGELRHCRKNGSEVIVASLWTLNRGGSGPAPGVVEVNSDITEARRTEMDRLRLAAIVESSDDAIISKNLEGVVTSWNRAAEHMLGYTAEEMIGQKIAVLAPPGLEDDMPRILNRIRSGQLVDHYETRRRRKDGTVIEVSLTVSPIYDRSGKIIGASKIARDVTERKRTAAALQQARGRADEILESISDGFYAIDREWRFTYVNRRALDLFGQKDRNLLGRQVYDAFPAGKGSEVEAQFRQVLADRTPREFEAMSGFFNRCFSFSVYPHPDGGLSVYFRDISARKQSERALQESDARFRATFEQAAVGMAQVGLDGRWLRVNQRLCQIAGYEPEELLHLTFQELTHPDDLDTDLSHVQALLAGESDSYQIEKRYLTKSGGVVWALLTVALVHDQSGAPDYFISVIEDISARKEAERALRESEQRFRSLLENSPRMMWVNRSDGAVDYFNAACRDYFGFPVSMPGLSWIDAIHPEDRPAHLQARTQALATGVPYGADYRLRRTDGAYRWHAARVAPLKRDGQVYAWVGSAADIDDIRRMTLLLEERVEERTRRLAEANAELEAFAYSVAHDLRAPLRSMRGFSQALLEDYGDRFDETGRDFAGRIVSGAERLDDLINDLLAYSRLTRAEIRPEPVDLAEMVKQVLEQMRGAIGDRKAEILIDDHLPAVLGQNSILNQVLLNLVGNAVKFVAPGTRPHVRIAATCEASTVRVTVEDNGIGFERKHADRVFKVFERLHGVGSPYPGTGIGLAIVKKGIERLGGKVGVESEPGNGSRFWFELPSAEERHGNP